MDMEISCIPDYMMFIATEVDVEFSNDSEKKKRQASSTTMTLTSQNYLRFGLHLPSGTDEATLLSNINQALQGASVGGLSVVAAGSAALYVPSSVSSSSSSAVPLLAIVLPIVCVVALAAIITVVVVVVKKGQKKGEGEVDTDSKRVKRYTKGGSKSKSTRSEKDVVEMENTSENREK